MRSILPTLALASLATAFPRAMLKEKSDIFSIKDQYRAILKSRQGATESNCGPIPCLTFDAQEQLVDVSPGSPNEYVPPGPNDLRGPCPGLNAAANHGFIPHNGVTSLLETTTGLAAAFGMDPEFAAFLAVVGIVFDGDPLAETWSIGGPYQGTLGLLGTPEGISYSHNKYEGDSSATRSDAYLNDGDAYSVVLSKFEHLYSLGSATDRYTLDTLRDQYQYNQNLSVYNNPYYFNGAFSGLLVVPAAHDFIINFFSNHSAEEPSGYLDGYNLKSFFGITGEPGSFVWNAGTEQIPQNWYRRPSTNPYTSEAAVIDVLGAYAKYPETVKLGGNMGTVNSFAGVDIGDLTGGVYNSETLLEGNNFGCFVFQSVQQVIPDALQGALYDTAPILELVNSVLTPLIGSLDCPTLDVYNQGLFNQFPGYGYNPKG